MMFISVQKDEDAFARLNRGSLGGHSADAQGCLLTSGPALTPTPGDCITPFNETTAPAYLPGGYQNTYRWYSIVYLPGAAGTPQYILTFAPSSGGSPATIATQPAIGYSPAEILQQLKNAGAPRTAYGMAQTFIGVVKFVTPDSPAVPTPVYEVPKKLPFTYYVPAGSVGLISPL
jgi:hypothetical protein